MLKLLHMCLNTNFCSECHGILTNYAKLYTELAKTEQRMMGYILKDQKIKN